jgi:hypothetical protein
VLAFETGRFATLWYAQPGDLPASPLSHHDARSRHVPVRRVDRARLADRHFEVLQPLVGSECGAAMGSRGTRHRTGRIECATGAPWPALCARYLHGEPRHHRRHDGQQRRRARRVWWDRTIDHVREMAVALADSSVAHFREMARSEAPTGDTFEAACYRTVLGARACRRACRRD